MPANQNTDDSASHVPEKYNPATNLSPVEVSRAFATLSSEGVDEFNQSEIRTDGTVDDADRVLVSLDAELAEWVKRRAWESERGPNETLDALVKHGNHDYEDALGLRDR